MSRLLIVAGLLFLLSGHAHAGGFTERTEWVMGTALRVVLPTDHPGRDAVFAACFATARRWDALLSPWRPEAPLSRLSAAGGGWVSLPEAVLDYLERARGDAERTGHVFDITLAREGSRAIEVDRAGARARLLEGVGPLDPGGDGKGVALDAMAGALDAAGVTEALVDFGGSSFLARGGGPDGGGWEVALTGPDGEVLGVLSLRDTALGVSSTVQRDHGEDGVVAERFHLRDLRSGEAVTARRTVAVLGPSATDAEVLGTAAAILGVRTTALLDRFPGCALAIFDADESRPLLGAGFAAAFRPAP